MEIDVATPLHRRGRVALVIAATLAVHVGVLAAAFALRAPEPAKPQTKVVSTLTGHVTETGDFEAIGMIDARIRR